jgi:hypothetical protein
MIPILARFLLHPVPDSPTVVKASVGLSVPAILAIALASLALNCRHRGLLEITTALKNCAANE